MQRTFFCLFLAFGFLFAQAHPFKPNHYIVVDTDGGIDDMRALTLLLSASSVQVMAITVSNGAVDAHTNYLKIKSLLEQYKHQGILVGLNGSEQRKSDFMLPHNFPWGDSVFINDDIPKSYEEVLDYVSKNTKEALTFVNLGSLNTLANYLNHNPDFSIQLKKVTWAVGEKINESYNYKIDTEAYSKLLNKNIPIDCAGIPSRKYSYTSEIASAVFAVNNKYAKNYYRSIDGSQPHFLNILYDELAVVQLLKDSIRLDDLNATLISKFFCEFLKGNDSNRNQVFQTFPLSEANYFEDILLEMPRVVPKFGLDEWRACVITNELHGHVGVYSLIGAKMGIRAREYFGCGVDELKVQTFVGNRPPLSCMNDGIQVSTGATIGHGLISICDSLPLMPKAEFEYMGQKVLFKLKPVYTEKIKREIKQLVIIYGIDSDIYWDLVRQFALNCWFNWDRNELFEIVIL